LLLHCGRTVSRHEQRRSPSDSRQMCLSSHRNSWNVAFLWYTRSQEGPTLDRSVEHGRVYRCLASRLTQIPASLRRLVDFLGISLLRLAKHCGEDDRMQVIRLMKVHLGVEISCSGKP